MNLLLSKLKNNLKFDPKIKDKELFKPIPGNRKLI